MPWPLSQDYNEAIQTPSQCFADADLKQGEAVTNALGMPQPCSGNFADVYAVESGQRKWAVKCFTRQIPGIRERYAEISKYLKQTPLPFTVEFSFHDQGIRIRGEWYPILKMQWVEGLAFNALVRDRVDKPQTLQAICQIWVKMAAMLREANLAHGDLQHGNVLLVTGSKANTLGVKLVDYDGMCVPSLELLKATEVGHPAYQHPQRLREGTYGLEIDRFSHLVIYTALRGLVVGGRRLWDRFDNGDNLLFTQKDFEAPAASPVFKELLASSDAEVRKLAGALADAARQPVNQAPTIEDILPSVTPRKTVIPQQADKSTSPTPVIATGRSSGKKKGSGRLVAGVLVSVLVATLALGGVGAFILTNGAGKGDRTRADGKVVTTEGKTPDKKNEQKNVEQKNVEQKKVARERVYLVNIKETECKGEMGWSLGKGALKKDGREPIMVAGTKYPRALGLHPPSNGYSSVTYTINGEMETFVARVAMNGLYAHLRPKTAVHFQVVGDGIVLWQTPTPISAMNVVQECEVSVKGISVLDLRTVCSGSNNDCHAVWLDPYLLKDGDGKVGGGDKAPIKAMVGQFKMTATDRKTKATNSRPRIWVFTEDGKAIEDGVERGKWRVDGENVIIDYVDKANGTAVLQFTSADALTGVSTHASGATFDWVLQRDLSQQVNDKAPIVNSIGMKLVLIPSGEFTMGSADTEANRQPNEGPQHRVRITKPFYMGVYEVKRGEYEKVMGKTPSVPTEQDFPAGGVTWNEAVTFCTKLSESSEEKKAGRTYRLPTEAEWEYACRAETTTAFHYGNALSFKQASFNGEAPYGGGEKGPKGKATKVGSYDQNAWGLYDMHGSVWEWCADDARTYGSSPATNPKGPEIVGGNRVFRGGSVLDAASDCRSARRVSFWSTSNNGNIGFRVVMEK